MTDDVSPPVSEEVLDTAVEDAVEESNKEAVVEYDSEISFSSDIWPVIEKVMFATPYFHAQKTIRINNKTGVKQGGILFYANEMLLSHHAKRELRK